MPSSTQIVASGANDIAFTPEGSRFYVATGAGSISVYDTATHALLNNWAVGTNIGAIALSDNGATLVAVERSPSQDTAVWYRVNTSTGAVSPTATASTYPYNDVAIYGNGTVVLTGGPAYSTSINLATGVATPSGFNGTPSRMPVIVEGGNYAVIADGASSAGNFSLYDQTNGALIGTRGAWQYMGAAQGFNGDFWAISQTGNFIAQVINTSSQGFINIYSLSLNFIGRINTASPIGGISATPDGTSLYVQNTGTSSGTISRYSMASLTAGDQFTVPSAQWTVGVTGSELIMSPDGRYLLYRAASSNGLVDLIDLSGVSNDDQTLDGTTGADTLAGGIGNDTYLVNNAGDVVVENPGEGNDRINVTFNYTLPAGLSVETLASVGTGLTLTGNDSNNYLIGDTSANTINGMNGDDTIDGSGGNDNLFGGLGADRLNGGAGDDVLDGGDGMDILDGGDGNDTYLIETVPGGFPDNILDSGGTDTIVSAAAILSSPDTIENFTLTGTAGVNAQGNAANNIITGNSGANSLFGIEGDDTLNGGLGNDHLNGGSGNDVLDGGEGVDTMIGSYGDDIYVVDTGGESVFEYENEGTDEIRTTLSVYALPMDAIENLTFSRVGNSAGFGTARANVITGGSGYDELYGMGGNDTLTEGTGSVADALFGGEGDDIYIVTVRFSSTIEGGGQGIDTVRTTFDIYGLQANVENLIYTDTAQHLAGVGNALANVLTGNIGIDDLFGREGNDTLHGGSGAANTMLGQEGDDIYVVSAVGDTIIEFANEGRDAVQTALSSFTLRDNVEALVYTGSGAFTGIGTDMDNSLTGGGDADFLSGLGGADVIIGGNGADELMGGAGNDSFRYLGGETGLDRILDFTSGQDRLDLRDSAFVQTAIIVFEQGGAPAPTTANTTFLYNVNNGIVSVDLDGTGAGAAIQIAQLNAGLTLTVADFAFF